MSSRILDVSKVPIGIFTLSELVQIWLPIRFTPKELHVTREQHKKVLSSAAGQWEYWRGIPIVDIEDLEK